MYSILIAICSVFVALCAADAPCSKSYCFKQEIKCISNVKKSECFKLDYVWVHYKKGVLSRQAQTCCRFSLEQLSKMYLGCVTKVSSKSIKCEKMELKKYKFNFSTKCASFYCH